MSTVSPSKIYPPKIIGHRGACGYAPENTLASMRIAHELGVEWVEFDVMLTQDYEAIIMHDLTLDRTTNGKGNVANTNRAQIAPLDAGKWFDKMFINERVPTFQELLIYLNKMQLRLVVEIKPTPGEEITTAQKTIEVLQQYWPMEKSVPIISSATPECLTTVYQLASQLPLAFTSDFWLGNFKDILDSLHCDFFHIYHKELTPERVAQIKKTQRYLLAYTVNDPERAAELFSWGVDGVFSDYPDKIMARHSYEGGNPS